MPNTDALREAGVESWIAPRPASQKVEALRAASPATLASAVTLPVRALEMRVFWHRLKPLADQAVREFKPDVALVGHDMAAAWALDLPRELPCALTLHNLTWRWYLSRARLASGPKAALLRAEAARYRRHVLSVLPRYDLAIPVSTQEAEEVEATGLVRVDLIPTGVDTSELAPAPEPQDGPPRLLFTGTMSYPPNSEGIAWFVREAWPQVRVQVPDAELMVVGKDPPPEVQALAGDGVSVEGFVPSMAPYFAKATAVVVPILTGAGIRVKIVEAMSAGRAIVSTSLGWEGLPHVEPDRHLLVADEPAAFAAATVRLLREPELRRRLAKDARALAETEYDWRALGDRLEAALAVACTSR